MRDKSYRKVLNNKGRKIKPWELQVKFPPMN